MLECAPLGKMAVLPGKRDCPEDTADPDRRVRAGLIRWLLLGGDEAVRTHPRGVRLHGAWVAGALDFEGCKTRLDCSLEACLFPDRPIFQDAEVRGLYLHSAHCRQGLDLHRLKTETDVHLLEGFKATGLVDLGGAQIGRQLSCIGGQFLNAGQIALNCDAAQIGADVFLSGEFKSEGMVNLRGARIGGQLGCTRGQFLNAGKTALQCDAAQIGADVFLRGEFKAVGMADFVGATVGGALQIQTATLDGVFDGEGLNVKSGFYWQDITGGHKAVNLRHASLGVLLDDKRSWDGVGTLHLDGLTYDRIDSAMTVPDRIAWLDQNRDGTKDAGDRFLPQPWTQLAKVLTASGDRRAASRVREAREVRMARAEIRQGWRAAGVSGWGPFAYIPVILHIAWNALFRALFGYGHAPGRVWYTILPFLAGTALLFGHVYDTGQMAPNSAVILTSADWQAALRAAGEAGQPQFHWAGMNGHPPMPSAIDYETFSRWLYAFDLFIPLDAIGQEQAWAPSHDRGVWGAVGYWARFPIQLTGWVIAAVGAAVVTGLVGKKDDG